MVLNTVIIVQSYSEHVSKGFVFYKSAFMGSKKIVYSIARCKSEAFRPR